MLKNLKRAASIALSFAMAIQFGLADSYRVNAVEEATDSTIVENANTNETVETSTPQEEAPEPEAVTTENTQSDAVATPVEAETQSVELSYVAEDGTILKMAALRDFDLNHNLNTDTSVMLNFDGYTLKDVVINNSQTVAADQVNLDATSALNSVKFIYKARVVENNNVEKVDEPETKTEETKTEEASEDDAEADSDPETEVKEELPEYPAFDESATAGNVTVHATAAEGVLPRDSKLVVKNVARKAILNAVKETVSEKNKEVDSAIALDVIIVNKDGVEIQPNGVVNISFENAAVNGDEINVYHVSDDASAVTEVATNTQSFNTNHFSIYVITGENEVPLTTFNFVANGNIVSTQTVKTGDTLITPTAPDMDGKVFVGWYDGETKFEDFNTALTISETTTREITAKYEDALYVYFYNPAGTQIMRTEKVSDNEAHDFTNISYEVDATHKIVGWAAEKNGTENIADKITVPDRSTSVNVYAIIKEGYWISFDSDGGSIIDSQFVLHGDKLVLNENTNPTKPGYTFAGWYNGLSKVENGATVTSPMTLKAHWNAAQVSYTINYWQQKVTDDKNATDAQKTYEYVEAVTKKATTGTKISATNSKTYKGFKYNANNSSKNVEISGDGTTIINVYYDRVLCTVNFYVDKGYYWSDWQISKTVTGLYGANLPEGAWDTSTYFWYQTENGGGGCVLLTSFDFESAGYADNQDNIKENGVVTTCNFYGFEDNLQYKINYYNEQADGTFKLVQTIWKESKRLSVYEKYAGYVLYKYSTDENARTDALYWKNKKDVTEGKSVEGSTINIASKLKTYSLSYYNYNSVTKTEKNIKYTASLKSYDNYTPARPSELPSYYVFGGWYKDKACTTKFDFNTEKMPNANLQIYAKWTAKKINLTYNLNTPDGTSKKVNRDVDAGTIANTVLPSATTTSDYSFAGWYYADGNGNITKDAYNVNEAITKDTSVIGKWLYNGELKVVYDPGTEGTNAKVPTDSNIYAGGAKVTVAKNATTTSKKKFLGWKLKGNLYHPGDAFEVNKDLANDKNVITLTAIWGNEESSTTMSYDPGSGRGSVQTVPVKNNESVTLKSEKDLGYQAPKTEGKEYYFAGWATSMDDAINGKATYAAGQSVHVDVDGENVLYATWIEKTVITLVANSNTVTYNGEVQSIEGFKDVTDGYTITGLSAKATGTDFGEYKTEIKGTAKVTKDGKDVTEKVVVNVVPGQLTISKREVTLESETKSKPYDGTPLTRPDVKMTGSFVNGEVSDIKATGSVTNVSEGKVTNTITYKTSDKFNPDNYTIVVKEGKLSIDASTEKVTVNIKEHSGTHTYDSNEKTVEGYDVKSISNPLYTADDFKFNGTAKVSGTNAGTYDMEINVADFENKNTNFANVEFVIAEEGQLVIDKRSVTLESDTKSKPYDGTPLTRPDVKMTGSFVNGEVSDVKATGSVTNVEEGSVTNTITYKTENKFNPDNYSIVVKEGKLSITPVTDNVVVEIKGKTKTETYNGKTHSVEGYKYTNISNALYPEKAIHFEGAAKASRKEEGTSYMGLNATQFSNTSANFTNVTFRVTDGWLKVTPKSIDPEDEKTGIKVTKPSDTMYNGEEQKNKPTVEDTKTGATLVENVDYTLSYTAAVNAGTVEVTITGIGNYTGTAKTSYEITKRNVTLTSANDSKPYDKTPLTNSNVTIGGDGFVKEEGATYNVTGSQTKKGSSKNEFTYELKSNTKASNYTIKVVYGDLTVTAEDGEVVVVITGHKKSFEYDGNEKSVKGYDVSITKGSTYEVSDFTFNGNDEVKGTEAGTYDMGLKPEDFTNNNENYGNVTFRVTDGQLIITPKSITPDGPNTPEDKKTGITATDPADSIYDGKAHVNPLKVTDTKTGKDLVENKDYTLTYVGDVINVGTVKIEVKGIGNYTGEFTKKYQITPREYTVTTDSAEKPYDGTALTAGGRVNGLVEGETVNFKTTGSQTNAGTSDNTYELKFKGTAVETNYKHGKDSIGTLTVKKQSIDPGEDPDKPNPDYLGIEISNPSDEVYDGKEHKWSPTVVDKIGKDLIVGTDYAVEYETSDFTNVGTITVTITGVGNYTGKVTRTYSITPREYTITTLDGTKVYDGKALTNFGLVDGIVYGETYSFKTTGSQTEVGSSDNTYEFKWDGTALKSNYKLAKESIGKLTVKAKSIIPDEPDTPEEKKTGITVNEPSDSMYDGQEHKEVLTVSDTRSLKALEANKDYSVTYSGDLVNAGTVTITVTGKGNYTGTFAKAYKITKRSITLTSATESKTYDGNPLTNTSIKVSGDGFAKGEGATYEVTGSQTEVGDSANAFEYKLNENTLASNYDITKVVGTLTVTRDTTPVTPAPTPTTPSVPPVVQRVVPTPTPVPEEKVEEEQTPKAEPKEEEKVEEDYTPKATQEYYWALINLICAIVTVLFGLLLLISKRHKDEDDEEEDDETKQQATTNEDEEQEQEKKRGLFTRVLAVLIAIVSVVFFLVTEDLSLSWTWTDQWTIWMVVIGLVQIVVFFVGRKWKNVDDDEDEEEAQQA